MAYSGLSHYLNQCWIIVYWTLRKKLHWNFNQNTKLFIHKNASENMSVKYRPFFQGGGGGGGWVKITNNKLITAVYFIVGELFSSSRVHFIKPNNALLELCVFDPVKCKSYLSSKAIHVSCKELSSYFMACGTHSTYDFYLIIPTSLHLCTSGGLLGWVPSIHSLSTKLLLIMGKFLRFLKETNHNNPSGSITHWELDFFARNSSM